MMKKEWTIIGVLGAAVVVVFLCLGVLVLVKCPGQSTPTSPAVVQIVTTVPSAQPTRTAVPPIGVPSVTNTPRATETPQATPLKTISPIPIQAPKPISTPTSTSGQPVSQYNAALSVQVKGGDSTLTIRRVEFWEEIKDRKPKNGLFLVLIGELSNTTGKKDCPTSDDFSLYVGNRKYSTSSSEMGWFRPFYEWNYPGSFLGQCITGTEATYLVFDIPFQLGRSRLVFRGASMDLGDLGLALQKSKIPVPTLESQVRALVEGALGAGNRSIPRIQKIEIVDNRATSEKNILVIWAIDDSITEEWINKSAKLDATGVFRALYSSGLPISQVELQGTFSMVDKYGNASEDTVVKLILDKTTANRINWENFLTDNVYTVAKVLYLHPSFGDK
jgi:hypothetical protein